MTISLSALCLIVINWALLIWCVVVGVPQYFKIRLITEISGLRARLIDEIFAQSLPGNDEAVSTFLDVTDNAIQQPHLYGLTEARAAHEAEEKFGCRSVAGYENLSPPQRRKMHDYEKELRKGLRVYIVFGSRFWPLLAIGYCVRRLVRKFDSRRNDSSVKDLGPSANELAVVLLNAAGARMIAQRAADARSDYDEAATLGLGVK